MKKIVTSKIQARDSARHTSEDLRKSSERRARSAARLKRARKLDKLKNIQKGKATMKKVIRRRGRLATGKKAKLDLKKKKEKKVRLIGVKKRGRKPMKHKAVVNDRSERETILSHTHGLGKAETHSVGIHHTHPQFEMDLRPKDQDGLAEVLLKDRRKFTRRFVRDYYKAWLEKYFPHQAKRDWLIDHVNRVLKDNFEKVFPKQVEPKEHLKTDHENKLPSAVPAKKRGRKPKKKVEAKIVEAANKTSKYHIPRIVYTNPRAFLGDGGCLGFNLIESDAECYREPVRLLHAVKKEVRRKAKRTDSECSSEREYKAMSSKYTDSLKKVSAVQFRREFKEYQRQMKGIQPYNFSNLGMVTLGKGEETVDQPLVSQKERKPKDKSKVTKKDQNTKKEKKVKKKVPLSSVKKSFKEDFPVVNKNTSSNIQALGKRAPRSPDSSEMDRPQKVVVEEKTTANTNKKSVISKAATPAKRMVLKEVCNNFLEDIVPHSVAKQNKLGTHGKASPAESSYRLEHLQDKNLEKKSQKASIKVKESLNKLFERVDTNPSVDKGKLSRFGKKLDDNLELTEKSKTIIDKVLRKASFSSIKKSLVKEAPIEPSNAILNLPETSVRFEEFLRPPTALPLPGNYSKLFKKFERLDDLMNFLNMKQTPSFISVITKAYTTSMNEYARYNADTSICMTSEELSTYGLEHIL
jgi:hypothetical protein